MTDINEVSLIMLIYFVSSYILPTTVWITADLCSIHM